MIISQTSNAEGEFRENLKETDWAWLAGFIDGEAYLGIRRGFSKNTNKNKKATSQKEWVWYASRISINNTHIKSMEKASAMIDGTLIKRKPIKSNYCYIYGTEISSREKIIFVLNKIIPYLIIKKDIANLILEFCKLPRGSGLEKEILYNKSVILSQAETGRSFTSRGLRRCDGQN